MTITIESEYGGGAEALGRGLAAALGLPCWDGRDLARAAEAAEALLCGGRMCRGGGRGTAVRAEPSPARLAAARREAVETLARSAGGCVFLEDCCAAGAILERLHPVRLFVYADRRTKTERCRAAQQREHLTAAELECRMRQEDRSRAKQCELFSEVPWGAKEAYSLCVNTSGREPEELVPVLAAYCRLFG